MGELVELTYKRSVLRDIVLQYIVVFILYFYIELYRTYSIVPDAVALHTSVGTWASCRLVSQYSTIGILSLTSIQDTIVTRSLSCPSSFQSRCVSTP